MRKPLCIIVAATLAGMPGAGSAASPGGNTGHLACIATPHQTEGPFFVYEKVARSDLRSDGETGRTTPGVPLRADQPTNKGIG